MQRFEKYFFAGVSKKLLFLKFREKHLTKSSMAEFNFS